MARRVSLPAADDLFRPTHPPQQPGEREVEQDRAPKSVRAVPDAPEETSSATAGTTRRPSGRVRHDEKMTVYMTSDELLDLEHARLTLRAEHGLAVDRGRLVREALHLVLADLEQNGESSALIRRITEE